MQSWAFLWKEFGGDEIFDKAITTFIYEDTGKGGLGVAIVDAGLVSYPWHKAIWYGFLATGAYLKEILISFYLLFKGLFSGEAVGEVARPAQSHRQMRRRGDADDGGDHRLQHHFDAGLSRLRRQGQRRDDAAGARRLDDQSPHRCGVEDGIEAKERQRLVHRQGEGQRGLQARQARGGGRGQHNRESREGRVHRKNKAAASRQGVGRGLGQRLLARRGYGEVPEKKPRSSRAAGVHPPPVGNCEKPKVRAN